MTHLEGRQSALQDTVNDDQNRMDELENEIKKIRKMSLGPSETYDQICQKIRDHIWDRLGGHILETLNIEHRRPIVSNNLDPSYIPHNEVSNYELWNSILDKCQFLTNQMV